MSLIDSSSSSEPGTETRGSESSSCVEDSSPASSPAQGETRSRSVPQCSRVSGPSVLPSSSPLSPPSREALRDTLKVTSGVTQICTACGDDLPIEVFVKLKGTRFRNPKCNGCRNKSVLTTPSGRAKVALLAEAKAKPCTDCGRSFPSECMDFDHLGEEKKAFNIAASWRWVSIDKLKAEIAKCELVCANCHRTRSRVRGYTGGRAKKFLAEVQRDALEVSLV